MSEVSVEQTETTKRLATAIRVWPIAAVAAFQLAVVVFWLTPSINNCVRFVAMMAGPLICGGLFVLLLVFTSRLRVRDSAQIIAAVTAMGVVTGLTAAPRSGIGAWMLGVPLTLALCSLGLALSRSASATRRTATVLGIAAFGWLLLGLSRIDGIDGNYMPEMSWRWQSTAEERLLKQLASDSSDVRATDAPWEQVEVGWSGFRGPDRNSRFVADISPMNWEDAPPKEIWRRPVGPGWSSMAVTSGRLFTQEQRGEDEAVVCYDAATGAPIWTYLESSRFEEVVSGAGPRATPTVSGGVVYAQGGMAVLVALDGRDGSLMWKHDPMREFGATLPVWGFSASPLVVEGLVITFAGGTGDNGLVAFDAKTGNNVWAIASANMNYSSAQLVNFAGEAHIAFVEPGAIRGLAIATGEELWRADVVEEGSFPMVQPHQVDGESLIVPTGDGKNVVRIKVSSDGTAWSTETVWDSRYLKPSYNDFVYYDGLLFGFDKQIFACIDAATGERLWKNGRYGFGQTLLVESAAQIIVVSESGKLVLLDANGEEHKERGSVEAMSGKTWNHPVIHAGQLYVRNAEEMVCFELF